MTKVERTIRKAQKEFMAASEGIGSWEEYEAWVHNVAYEKEITFEEALILVEEGPIVH